MISKSERAELRSIVKGRFKVLRADVNVRQAEMLSELDTAIRRRFEASDQEWSAAMFKINQAVDEANRRANDALRELGIDGFPPQGRDYGIVSARDIPQPRGGRDKLRKDGQSRIAAQVAHAMRELDRQENELLTELSVGALESTHAKAFMERIPSVASLIPADRMPELESTADRDTP